MEINMTSKGIDTIVVDLDRTLLRSDKTLSPYTASVLRACRAKGMRLMVATARPLREITRYCEQVEFDAVAISNGARIYCGGEQRAEHLLRSETAERILKALEKHPELCVTVENGICAYSNLPVSEYETTICSDLIGCAEREGAVKILVRLDREGAAEQVRSCLSEDVYTTVAIGYLLQIMDRSATKWNSVKTMLELTGGKPERTIYFGDDYDDTEPLARCGIGVAVANGIPEAKQAADEIAASNDEDGVANYLQARFL